MTFTNLLTRKQYLTTYAFAGAAPENVPGKNVLTFLCVPGGVTIVVAKHDRKSTYDEVLYRCEHLTREQFNARYVTGAK